MKTFPSKLSGTLHPNPVPDRWWQVISMDMIMELPESHGFDSMMIVVNWLSKQIHAMPMTTTVDSARVACLFQDNVWRHHGLPETIISDRGTIFTSKFMRELNSLLGIKANFSMAFHPQMDRQMEQVNQEIEQYLRIFINHHQNDWVEWLPIAEFAYNNQVHSSTHQTPFQLNSRQDPCLGTEPIHSGTIKATLDFITHMQKAMDEAQSALQKATEDMAHFYDAHCAEAPEYIAGDQVWLDTWDISTDWPTKKLSDKWLRPYKVKKVISHSAIHLKLPTLMKIHPVFHISKLHPFQPDPIIKQAAHPPPPPVLRGGEEEYEVKWIKNSWYFWRKLQYLVKWRDYPASDNEWIPEANLENAPDVIQAFHWTHLEAPRQINAVEFASIPFCATQFLTEPPSYLPDWLMHWRSHGAMSLQHMVN
jgi:Chromo (CHRromatin Organisation MOdifier) domain